MDRVRLVLEGVSKRFGKTIAVNDVSFEISNKEFFVIFGPSGAGKTTILNLIAGIVPPDSGKVILDGRVVNYLEPSERSMAMVFENYALYPHMSVFENMAFPLKSPKVRMNVPQIQERVTQVARVLKIDHLLNRPIQALSNGQRQRTALGRALVRSPDVFLMDEPLSHLDAKLRNLMRTELKLVQSQLDTTSIYVTHDYLEALSLGNRILVLNQGAVMQIGTPDEVYLQPATVAVAQGFGDPEINILDTRLSNDLNGHLTASLLPNAPGLRIDPEVAMKLNSCKEDVLIGFRPADVEVMLTHSNKALRGRVYSYEPLGARAILIIEAEGNVLVRALVDSSHVLVVNQEISFSVDSENLIFFEKNSGHFIARSSMIAEPSMESKVASSGEFKA